MTITNNIGIYVHIPFCIKKCRYCSFLSFPCEDERILSEYADALLMEIRTRYEEWPYRIADTVYIGGGTPSILPAKDMKKIVEGIKENFTLADGSEITIEANPATLTEEKLETYLECGINRISVGIQAFDNSILDLLGRAHNKNDGLNAIRMAKKAGFRNINIDLMFGIPGQTIKMWGDTMRQCIFLEPQHISLYSLQIEEGTAFHDMIYKDKIMKETPDSLDRQMYHEAIYMMEDAGYELYEISNAAMPGYKSRHNLKYWSYRDYLGLGPGASSFIGGHRFKNCDKVGRYLQYIKNGLPPVRPEDVENYTLRDEMGIYMFTGLRKTEGIRINEFESTFNVDFFDVYDPQIITDLRGLLKVEGNSMRLTAEGMDVSNRVMAAFV